MFWFCIYILVAIFIGLPKVVFAQTLGCLHL